MNRFAITRLAATAHRTAVAALSDLSAGGIPLPVTAMGARGADGRPRSSLLDLPRLAVIALLAGAFPAVAQTNCAPTAQVGQRLTDGYGETVQDVGLTGDGLLVQWWGNVATGTWTVVVSDPGGQSCIVVYGTDFEHAPAAPAPMGVLE